MRTILGEGYKDQGDIQCKEVGNWEERRIGKKGTKESKK
jgi:hypothetical protein